IKHGDNYRSCTGQIYSAEELTIPPGATRSYAYCSDTLYSDKCFQAIDNVDLLYRDATFMHDMLERSTETHHSTSIQSADIAKAVNAKKLVIEHFSSFYRDLEPLLLESRTVIEETYLAIEGISFSIDPEKEE